MHVRTPVVAKPATIRRVFAAKSQQMELKFVQERLFLYHGEMAVGEVPTGIASRLFDLCRNGYEVRLDGVHVIPVPNDSLTDMAFGLFDDDDDKLPTPGLEVRMTVRRIAYKLLGE